jgi:hypothetical protein
MMMNDRTTMTTTNIIVGTKKYKYFHLKLFSLFFAMFASTMALLFGAPTMAAAAEETTASTSTRRYLRHKTHSTTRRELSSSSSLLQHETFMQSFHVTNDRSFTETELEMIKHLLQFGPPEGTFVCGDDGSTTVSPKVSMKNQDYSDGVNVVTYSVSFECGGSSTASSNSNDNNSNNNYETGLPHEFQIYVNSHLDEMLENLQVLGLEVSAIDPAKRVVYARKK